MKGKKVPRPLQIAEALSGPVRSENVLAQPDSILHILTQVIE